MENISHLYSCWNSRFGLLLFLEMHMNRGLSVYMYMNRRLAALFCHHQCTGLELFGKGIKIQLL